jgi:diketogulonate reductase-like aldo/keto reductase
VEQSLNERAYAVIDVLLRVAKETGAAPAHVALAWVIGRPGVSSTIIGARTLQQLEANLAALDVKLAPEHLADLDEVSRPTLSFPAGFLEAAPVFMHGGLTVNGVTAPPWPLAPGPGSRRY